MSKTIMLQGTSSNVGKSVLTAALGRIFIQDGYKVAPFKAQNMALNSFVTASGGEMGRAQVVQAEACKVEPEVIMNPVLLKPTRNSSSQVIVLGKPVGNLSASDYHLNFKEKAWNAITYSLEKLNEKYQVLVIEGAGSPAEVNLKENDIVNMRVAKEIKAPVLLVADIDRGGALASIVGTLELLDQEERELVKGLVINKFRGDLNLLKPALEFLEKKTGKPVVGVIPFLENIQIPEEDSVALEKVNLTVNDPEKLDIVVITLPHISNFTDFDTLANEKDVNLRYVKDVSNLGAPDLIIIPGSKNTIEDMLFLKKNNFVEKIKENVFQKRIPVIGICGGYQLLGKKMFDPKGIESQYSELEGLGLLNIETVFISEKITSQVKGKVVANYGLLEGCQDLSITGYEIHMGITNCMDNLNNPFLLTERFGETINLNDGVLDSTGLILGTYIHGIFDNDLLRRQILNNLRKLKGWNPLNTPTTNTDLDREKAYNKLAQVVRENINLSYIYKIMGLS